MGRRHAAEEPTVPRPSFGKEVPYLRLGALLDEIEQWQAWNYGADREAVVSALALFDPSGALAAAVLKHAQGRHPEEWTADASLALADIFITLAGLAELLELDLEQCIRERWAFLRACDFTGHMEHTQQAAGD